MTTTDDDWVEFVEEGFIGHVGPIWQGKADPGKGRFRFVAGEKHRNRNGVVQGGMIMTFADRGLGATARQGDPRCKQATAQLDIHFVRSAKIGAVVEMTARVVRETRTMVFVEGEVVSEGNVIATAKGIWSILARD